MPLGRDLVEAAADVSLVARARRRPLRRVRAVIAGLLVATVAVVLARVLLGEYTVTLVDFARILRGETIEAAPGASFIVMEAKLPRALIGALAGGAFGAAGAMFQTTLRNPLASPDIIGISLGASAAAVIALTFFDAQGLVVPLAALAGAVAVSVVMYFVARGTSFAGQRMVLVGIGIAALALQGRVEPDAVPGAVQPPAKLDVLDEVPAPVRIKAADRVERRPPHRPAPGPKGVGRPGGAPVHLAVAQVDVEADQARLGRPVVVAAEHGSDGPVAQGRLDAAAHVGRRKHVRVDEEQHVRPASRTRAGIPCPRRPGVRAQADEARAMPFRRFRHLRAGRRVVHDDDLPRAKPCIEQGRQTARKQVGPAEGGNDRANIRHSAHNGRDQAEQQARERNCLDVASAFTTKPKDQPCARQDSNLRPSRYERPALTN